MEEFVERGAMLGGVYAGAVGNRLTEGMPRWECGESEGASVYIEVEVEADGGESGMVLHHGCRRGAEGTGDNLGCEALNFAQFIGDTD